MVCWHCSGRKLYRGRGHARGFGTARAYRLTNGVDGPDGNTYGSNGAADDGTDDSSNAFGYAVGNDVADGNDAALNGR